MKKCNDFSVLMPVYFFDDSMLFKRAIESVFTNTLIPKYLYIIVDGPLSSSLNSVIKFVKNKYKHRLKVYRLKKNMGLTKALNFGLKKISEEIIVRADADDINNHQRFSILISEINKGFDIVGSNITEYINQKKMFIRSVPTNKSDIKSFVRYRNPFNHMSVVFRRSKILLLGGYPELNFFEDYALWAKAIKFNLNLKNINKSLVNVSVNKNFYKRRGGYSYLICIYRFQKYLLSLNLINKKIFIFNVISRCIVAIAFPPFRKIFYNILLRSGK